jgi:hypothetical protein
VEFKGTAMEDCRGRSTRRGSPQGEVGDGCCRHGGVEKERSDEDFVGTVDILPRAVFEGAAVLRGREKCAGRHRGSGKRRQRHLEGPPYYLETCHQRMWKRVVKVLREVEEILEGIAVMKRDL